MNNPITAAYLKCVDIKERENGKGWNKVKVYQAPQDRYFYNVLKAIAIGAVGFLIIGLILFLGVRKAEGAEYTDTQIVNAIFKAEGSYKAQYLYGIRSVQYRDEAEARRICFNTVRNNRKRYAQYGYKKYSTYLEFLASRYCPVGCDNDRGTNKFWLKNIRYFLAKSEAK